MSKDKKKTKKLAKKAIKRHVNRNVKKPLTAEQTATQIDMMKTILSRQPNPLQAVDPQYRDLLQKNQQLNELKNKREFELNNMKKSIDDNERILKNISEERKHIDQMAKDNKRRSHLQQQQDKLDDKKDNVKYEKDTLDKKNALGKLQLDIKQAEKEHKQLKQQVRDNPLYQRYQQADIDYKVLLAQNAALKQQINSPEFNKPDNAYMKTLYDIGKAKLEQQHAQDVFNKQQELLKEKQQTQVQKLLYEEYMKPKQIEKRDNQGHLIYKKDKHGSNIIVNGYPVPEMVDIPGTSMYDEDINRTAQHETDLLKYKQQTQYWKARNDVNKGLAERNSELEQQISYKKAKIKGLEEINRQMKFKNQTGELTKEMTNLMKQKVETDIIHDANEQLYNQQMNVQKQIEKQKYIEARERELNSPNSIYREHEIAQAKIQSDYQRRKTDLMKQEYNAKMIERQHKNQMFTLNTIAGVGEQLDPSTIGQFVSQVNADGAKQIKDDINKATALNDSKHLKDLFNVSYGSDGDRVYNMVMRQYNFRTPDASNDINDINKVNTLLQYTLDNLQVDLETGAPPLNEFINSDGFKHIFEPPQQPPQ